MGEEGAIHKASLMLENLALHERKKGEDRQQFFSSKDAEIKENGLLPVSLKTMNLTACISPSKKLRQEFVIPARSVEIPKSKRRREFSEDD